MPARCGRYLLFNAFALLIISGEMLETLLAIDGSWELVNLLTNPAAVNAAVIKPAYFIAVETFA